MKFAFFILLLTIILLSCAKSDTDIKQIAGGLISNSGCKSHSKSAINKLGDGESCVEYSYNASNHSLSIKHTNAIFNCCPKSIDCAVDMSGDLIVVTEFETLAESVCNCNCFYDLGIIVNQVEAKKYSIKIIEPHSKNLEKLSFDIDLTNKADGSYCVFRSIYDLYGTTF